MHAPVLALSGRRTITRNLVANVGLTVLVRTGFDILMSDSDSDNVLVDTVESSQSMVFLYCCRCLGADATDRGCVGDD